MAVKILSVDKGSPADKAGIKAGESLVSINGNEINDVLDYRFYMLEKKLKIELENRTVKLKKDEYDEPGLEFETYLMDEKRHCKNNCIFCFIAQLPKGMRESLYFKDDDARLSFLQGNYITLTNITEQEVDRIIKMRLKVNVSVHTTNPELRIKMTRNPNAGKALEWLFRIAKAGNELNCQLVLCPGINDGEELRKSLSDLTALYPAVTSIACVPLGKTKYREGLMELKGYDKRSAAETIDIIESFGDEMEKKYGDRLVYPADEFFLLAERPIPEYEYYGDFEQYENGVGMWSSMEKEFADAVTDMLESGENVGKTHKTIATGKLAKPLMEKLSSIAREHWDGVEINVAAIRNDFFGETITVAGLITGGDIIKQLTPIKDKLGSELLIPDTMLRANSDVFLDDVTVGDVEKALGLPVKPIRVDGNALLCAMLDITESI